MQHQAASALGVDEGGRTDMVLTMLQNNARRAPGYWIQLGLATGIATLGLALDSTAVVIGAMLVSPLMGPILELGMGLAVGSALLVIRASIRSAMSIAVVIAGAALLTVALPFHEVTHEIAARTAPTALDLFVAAFCALTAAYTTVRPTSDTTSAAAGTAVGIALVPPLCVSGFGLGIGSVRTAGGAALLFTANISAIVLLAALSFVVLGYDQVDAQMLEERTLPADATRADRLAARGMTFLHSAFGSRYGLLARLLVPVILLAAVAVPLYQALGEVSWQVRARNAIRGIVSAELPGAIQSTLSVERHTIDLSLLVVGTAQNSAPIELKLANIIDSATGVRPTVRVTAVPNTQALSEALQRRDAPTEPNPARLDVLENRVQGALQAIWPVETAGPVAGWDIVVGSAGAPTIRIRHIGQSLGPTGVLLLSSALGARLGGPVRVIDEPMAPEPIVAARGREREWLNQARRLLEWVGNNPAATACVTGPLSPDRRLTATQQVVRDSVRSVASTHPERIVLTDSSQWSVRVVVTGCDSSRPAAPR